MNKPESNKTTESLSASEERISKLYSRLADILDYLIFKDNDLRKQKSEHIEEIMSKDIEKFIVPIYKAIQVELIKLDRTEPKKAILYYKQIKNYIDYFCKYYPVLFSFWTFEPETRGTSIQTTEKNITEQAIAVIEDEPGDELDPEQREKANIFCDLCNMPMALAEACAIASKGKPEFENTLLFLWNLHNGSQHVELSDTPNEVLKLFKVASDMAIDGTGNVSGITGILKEINSIIEEKASEEKLHEILDQLEIDDQQRSHFIMSLSNYDRSVSYVKKSDNDAVIPPKWTLIASMISRGQGYLKKRRDSILLLGAGNNEKKLLPLSASSSLETVNKNEQEKPKSADKNICEKDLLKALEEIEAYFDSEYNKLMGATMRQQEQGSQCYEGFFDDFDIITTLPLFMGLLIDEYQKILIDLAKRGKARISEGRNKKLTTLYAAYEEYMPAWIEEFDLSPQESAGRVQTLAVVEDAQSARTARNLLNTKMPQRTKKLNLEANLEIIRRATERITRGKYNDLYQSIDRFEDKMEKSGIRLTDEEKEKLVKMFKSYTEAVATAREICPDIKLPSELEVEKALYDLGNVQLEKIANHMQKPGLVIVPPNMTGQEIIDAMDLTVNRHFPGQNKAIIHKILWPRYSDLWLSEKKERVGVSIVEMTPYVNNEKEIPIREFYREKGNYFNQHGLRHVTVNEYLIAAQSGIIEETGDSILDFDKTKTSFLEILFGKSLIHFTALGRFTAPNRMPNGKEVESVMYLYAHFSEDVKSIVLTETFASCRIHKESKTHKEELGARPAITII